MHICTLCFGKVFASTLQMKYNIKRFFHITVCIWFVQIYHYTHMILFETVCINKVGILERTHEGN